MKDSRNRPAIPLFSIAFSAILLNSALAAAQAPVPGSPAVEAQAHALVARLTLEQKIELMGGIENMFTRPMPAIGLPRFKMSDGPVGVRTWGPATAYTAGAALAATWDTGLARKSVRAWDATRVPAALTSCSAPA